MGHSVRAVEAPNALSCWAEPPKATDPCMRSGLADCTTFGPDCACNGSRIEVAFPEHDWNEWEDDVAGVIRSCAECGAIDFRPES